MHLVELSNLYLESHPVILVNGFTMPAHGFEYHNARVFEEGFQGQF